MLKAFTRNWWAMMSRSRVDSSNSASSPEMGWETEEPFELSASHEPPYRRHPPRHSQIQEPPPPGSAGGSGAGSSLKVKRSSGQGGSYSPPNQNHLPRNHVIGSRARYEIQMLDSAFLGYSQGKQVKEDNQNIFGFFKRERRPSDKHKEFVDMLQFPKGNK